MVKLSKYIIIGLCIALSSCVGYQSVKEYDRIDGKMVKVKIVRGLIIGTSGQSIDTKDIKLEKNDTSDKAISLVKSGLEAGVKVASNAGGLL